jgi:phosphoribosylformimino-5-aminoimidazole carboxamide ribotide isomerase
VDLDGAAQGRPGNQNIINQIIRRTTIPVQVGGGVRDIETAAALVEAGADRVIIGTAAVEDAGLVERLCQRYGSGRLVVAVDAQDGQVAIKGWTERTPLTALDLAQRMKGLGVCRLLYTDISRDGTLTEPNFLATGMLVQETGLAVLASGGITSLEHIRRLAGLGAEGAILGRALYDGTINLGEALDLVNSLLQQ